MSIKKITFQKRFTNKLDDIIRYRLNNLLNMIRRKKSDSIVKNASPPATRVSLQHEDYLTLFDGQFVFLFRFVIVKSNNF